MPQKLMDVLMLGRCSHEFSWPRRAADGHYYQVCLLCAAEYKYDWKTMKRIKRVASAPEATAETQRSKKQQEADLGSAGPAPGVADSGPLSPQGPGNMA